MFDFNFNFKEELYEYCGNTIHKEPVGDRMPPGYIWLVKPPNLVDSIGLSISDYLSIRAELRPIFFIDGDNKRADADIVALIFASPYLNLGYELTGDILKGAALYPEGTASAVLKKAYRYFDKVFETDFAGNPVNSNPDIGAFERI